MIQHRGIVSNGRQLLRFGVDSAAMTGCFLLGVDVSIFSLAPLQSSCRAIFGVRNAEYCIYAVFCGGSGGTQYQLVTKQTHCRRMCLNVVIARRLVRLACVEGLQH
jgi:hypothetical protein